MIRVEFPDAAGCGRAFAMRCHVISSIDKYGFFPLGNGNSSFPSLSILVSLFSSSQLCSRLLKYTMFRNVCQVADYVNVHVSERLSNGHVQSRGDPGMVFTIRNLFMKPASSNKEGTMPVSSAGARNRPVTLVEYGDYECPYC